MQKLLIVLVLLSGIYACKKPGDGVSPNDTAGLLSANSWQLDRYTDTSGKFIPNTDLKNAQAVALYGLVFEFKAGSETRAFDKLTKNIVNKGTWSLIDENKTMEIKITGFDGKFKVVSISKGKLILQTNPGSFLTGIGSDINLEFSTSK